MLEQAGVRRVLHITAVDVIKQGNNLPGVITEVNLVVRLFWQMSLLTVLAMLILHGLPEHHLLSVNAKSYCV